MTDKKPIDWEAVETDYRAGMLSLREMAAAHGVSHVSVKKRADRDGWTRDLSAKIKAKADAMVNRAVATSLGNAERTVNDRLVIEANAERIAQVRGEHRTDISRARRLALMLLAELEGVTENVELFRELGDVLRSEDDKGVDKRNDLYAKVIDLPSRIGSAKQLSETLKNLIALEREAYGLEAAPTTLNVEQRTTVVDAHAVKEVIDRLEADY